MADFGKLNFSVSFNRTSAFPLDGNAYFTSLSDAQNAAKTAVEVGSAESTYYIGQTLTVVEKGNIYICAINTDKSLLILNSIIEAPLNSNTYGRKNGEWIALPDFSTFATKNEIPSLSGYATENWVNQQGFITGIPSEYITEEELNNKNYATVKQLSNKQDTLQSGTNIKTINGETILGSGDITIEVGGGVGKVDPNSDGTGEIFNDYTNNKATGKFAHAEGSGTQATGESSHAEGGYTQANGYTSHAEGAGTKANGNYSHAEGSGTQAIGDFSHVEGRCTGGINYYLKASGEGSHAEGYVQSYSSGGIEASGKGSHAEGYVAHNSRGVLEASGIGSHAEGFNMFDDCHMIAQGSGSHIQNVGTVARNYGQTSMGCFNEDDESPNSTYYNAINPALLIGNGTSNEFRGNAFKVLFNGQTFADGEYSSAGADYAEMFEWKDGNLNNEDRVGLFVTLDGDKIRLATATDTYILGIISGAPTIIGDNPMRWHNKYLNDEWGRPIYEDVEVTYKEFEKQEDGTEIEVEKTRIDHVRKLNPDYNPKEKYIPRSERPEWDYVGMMGKLLVKQDGTLVAGSFCKSGNDGVATKAESGYYVMKVINENQALILFR